MYRLSEKSQDLEMYSMSEIKQTQRYFKLTTANLKSACTSLNSGWGVLYKVGEWVKPVQRNSKLFVFSSMKGFEKFANGLYGIYGIKIFECEIKEPTTILGISRSVKLFADFWDGDKYKFLTRYGLHKMQYAPLDTVACSEVKLMREI